MCSKRIGKLFLLLGIFLLCPYLLLAAGAPPGKQTAANAKAKVAEATPSDTAVKPLAPRPTPQSSSRKPAVYRTIEIASYAKNRPKAVDAARLLESKGYADVRVELINGLYIVRVGFFQSVPEGEKILAGVRALFPKSILRKGYKKPERVVYPSANKGTEEKLTGERKPGPAEVLVPKPRPIKPDIASPPAARKPETPAPVSKTPASPAPPPTAETGNTIKTEPPRLLSLELKNADLNDVLRLFSQEYGFNIVAGKEVAGNVTTSFTNVPLEEALRAILAVNGFGYEKVGNLTLVSTLANLSSRNHPLYANSLVTRIFTLNYVSAERIKEIVLNQLTPKIGTVDVMTSLYVGGWKMGGISTTAKDIVEKERAINIKEENPKILIVTDLPAVVARVETIIRQLDVKPSQILIDAMIVEIDSNYVRDIGIDWTKTGTGNYISTLPTALDSDFFTKGLSITYENSPLILKIKALEKTGKANILSNPRIMALDNYPAVIMVGERYPIINTTTTYNAGVPTYETKVDWQPIGITLRVIPHVNQAGTVEMIIHPEITSLGDLVTSVNQSFPRINSREADTNVTVKDGQTVVIGGLLTNETKDTSYKVPFLGDIPVLGYLFKRTVKEPKKQELLIFITPRIADEPAEASALLQEKAATVK